MEILTILVDVTTTSAPLFIEESYRHLRLIYYIVNDYLWIGLVAFGVPGNTICACVARRKRNRNVSMCTYVFALAISDTLFLLQLVWYYPLVTWNLGKHITRSRDMIFK